MLESRSCGQVVQICCDDCPMFLRYGRCHCTTYGHRVGVSGPIWLLNCDVANLLRRIQMLYMNRSGGDIVNMLDTI